jgi:hypothetical protein
VEAQQDKRFADRVEAAYDIEYALPGHGADGVGCSLDLSDTGLRFRCDVQLQAGADVTLRVPSRKPNRPALLRSARVVRCMPLDEGDGFAVCCAYD